MAIPISSGDLKDIIRMICSTALGIMGFKLAMTLITEVLCKHCHSCGKKAGWKW